MKGYHTVNQHLVKHYEIPKKKTKKKNFLNDTNPVVSGQIVENLLIAVAFPRRVHHLLHVVALQNLDYRIDLNIIKY